MQKINVDYSSVWIAGRRPTDNSHLLARTTAQQHILNSVEQWRCRFGGVYAQSFSFGIIYYWQPKCRNWWSIFLPKKACFVNTRISWKSSRKSGCKNVSRGWQQGRKGLHRRNNWWQLEILFRFVTSSTTISTTLWEDFWRLTLTKMAYLDQRQWGQIEGNSIDLLLGGGGSLGNRSQWCVLATKNRAGDVEVRDWNFAT